MARRIEAVERVWDYPRPPVVVSCARCVRVEVAGRTLAESDAALRVLETSHPPTIYIPPAAVRMDLLRPSATRATLCEFKGVAGYWDLSAPAGPDSPGDMRYVQCWYMSDGLAIMLGTLLPLIWFARYQIRRAMVEQKADACPFCGYDLRGSLHACPECGRVPPWNPKRRRRPSLRKRERERDSGG